MRRTHLLCMVMAVMVMPSFALADSISPSSDSATINLGQTYSVQKTVTVDGYGSGTNFDVVFVFDTTSSWASFFGSSVGSGWTDPTLTAGDLPTRLVNAVTSRASNVGGTASFGIVTYQDFPSFPWGAAGDNPYNLFDSGVLQDATTTISSLKTITTGNGGDLAESGLHALGNLASDVGWNSGSQRVVLWFGDQPNHPDFETAGPIGPTYPGGFNKVSATAALAGQNVVVEAFNFDDLDGIVFDWRGNPLGNIDSLQATYVTSGTGGSVWDGFWNPANTSDSRFDALMTAVGLALDNAMFPQYTVSLGLGGVPGAMGLTATPPGTTTGSRASTETFIWNLLYGPTAAGQYGFTIDALVNGQVVGTETDSYLVVRGGGVTPGPEIPEPSTVALLGLGLLGVGVLARRRRT